jgi:ubiquinone biosynthesis protein
MIFRSEDIEPLKDEVYAALRQFQMTELGQFNVGSAMDSLPKTMRKYNVTIPGSLTMVLKVISMIYTVAVKLDPQFNFDTRVQPYFDEIVKGEYFSPETVKKIPLSFMDMAASLMAFPKAINNTLNTLGKGDFKLEIKATDIEVLSTGIQQASGMLVVSIIVASIVIGSSLIVFAAGIPITGNLFFATFAIYFIAIVIGLAALYHVLRK